MNLAKTNNKIVNGNFADIFVFSLKKLARLLKGDLLLMNIRVLNYQISKQASKTSLDKLL
jgi:hypothetical protein